jgi:hypothetical protein
MVHVTRIRSIVAALLLAGLSTFLTVAAVFADGSGGPLPH